MPIRENRYIHLLYSKTETKITLLNGVTIGNDNSELLHCCDNWTIAQSTPHPERGKGVPVVEAVPAMSSPADAPQGSYCNRCPEPAIPSATISDMLLCKFTFAYNIYYYRLNQYS